MKFGLNLRFRNPPRWKRPWDEVYADNLRFARLAEEMGFDGIWVPEHHSSPDGYNPTPFVVLAAIAATTERIKLGTQMLLLPLHNPVYAAEEACAVDVISGGRLILGIGSGYRHEDFNSIGVNRDERKTLMDEGVELLYRCFTEAEPFSFNGKHYSRSDIDVQPRSIQQPHPQIFMSVRSKSAARRAGKYGASANILVRQGDAERLYAPYVEALENNGMDPATCEVATVADSFIAETDEAAVELAGEYQAVDAEAYFDMMMKDPDPADRRFIEGGRSGPRMKMTPDGWTQAIEGAIKLFEDGPVNLGWFNMSVWPPGMDAGTAEKALELFATKVVPRFK